MTINVLQGPDVLVLGGSLAGLLAAAACAPHARSVTVLERDALPTDPAPRPGVPQGAHLHVLLHRGLLAMEDLLPGLRADLLAVGATAMDTGDMLWLGPYGWFVPGEAEYDVLCATRPLVEHVVRRRVASLPGVVISDGVDVRGLLSDRRRVDGVRLSDGSDLRADLVIDATGRNSRLPTWLGEIGISRPQEDVIDAHVGYSSQAFVADRSWFGGAALLFLTTPETGVGGNCFPVEEGRWLLTAMGVGDRRPPRDGASLRAFLDRLPDPALSEFAAAATPVGDVCVHRRTANQRRRYDKVPDWPAGLLVLGDAYAAFDPIYGQGITVAAMQALALRVALPGLGRSGAERRLLRRFARIVLLPWSIATNEDLRYPTTDGTQGRLPALFGRYTAALMRLASHGDRRARHTTARVYHLMGSPVLLFSPALLASVLRARLLGDRPAVPRPAELDRASASSR